MEANICFTQQLIKPQDVLFRFAYRLTADRDEANDLLQETSLKVLTNAESYMEETSFKGWVLTIMRNLFINNYRRILRGHTIMSEETLTITNNEILEDSVDTTYDISEIQKVIKQLPTEYRVPFSMYVAGFKYREIADKLGLPIGTVKSRIFFTRKQLKTELKDFL